MKTMDQLLEQLSDAVSGTNMVEVVYAAGAVLERAMLLLPDEELERAKLAIAKLCAAVNKEE